MTGPSYGFAAPCPVCLAAEAARERAYGGAYQARPLGLYSSSESLARHQLREHGQELQVDGGGR